MKILIYCEPWIEIGIPKWKTGWLRKLAVTFNNLVTQNKDIHFDIMFLIGDAQKHDLKSVIPLNALHKNAKVQFTIISQKALRRISPNYLDATLKQYRDTFTEKEMTQLTSIFRDQLKGFVPDIIYSFMSQLPHMKRIYPNTLILHTESGIVTRNPYPSTLFVDPFGTFSYGYVGKFNSELHSLILDTKKQQFLDTFREYTIDNSIRVDQPFTKDELIQTKKLKYLVLLPLQVSPYFSYNAHVTFQDQFDFLCYVLDRIDSEVGVVITQHSDWDDPLRGDGMIDYITSTYPNAIISDKLRETRFCSQYLMDLVDGVISVSSTVGLQALIFQKPLFVIGNNQQLLTISAGNDISMIKTVLDKQSYKNHDAILYHLLTHYYLMEEGYINDGKWFYNFLKKCLIKHKENAGFDFFDKIDDDKNLLKLYKNQITIRVNDNQYLIDEYKKTIQYQLGKLFNTQSFRKFRKIEAQLDKQVLSN